jgi:glycosyltransferase involved in cell wall biosynthesis
VDRARVEIVPCGVDTRRFSPGARRAEPPLVVCVARLVPVKNLGLLLEACGRLRDRGRSFRCAIVGDGRSRGELVELRDRLRLGRIVDLVGAAPQREVLAWWRRASVATLTSDSEGMPVSLMEAGACGVPAVATAVGGAAEVVENGVTGLLAPPGGVAAVAAGLDRLLGDQAFAARLGAAARRRVVERFSLERQVDGLVSLWSRLA